MSFKPNIIQFSHGKTRSPEGNYLIVIFRNIMATEPLDESLEVGTKLQSPQRGESATQDILFSVQQFRLLWASRKASWTQRCYFTLLCGTQQCVPHRPNPSLKLRCFAIQMDTIQTVGAP